MIKIYKHFQNLEFTGSQVLYELCFYHFTVASCALFSVKTFARNSNRKSEVHFCDDIQVLLQRPAHFSINSKISSDFSMRDIKHSYICNVSI